MLIKPSLEIALLLMMDVKRKPMDATNKHEMMSI
jgi:hypothetical protein